MLTTLNTAYADTRARDLTFALGLPLLDALDALPLQMRDARFELRLLGASHQVVLDTRRGSCTETVACLPGHEGPLPRVMTEKVGGLSYTFSSQVEALASDAFRNRVTALVRSLGHRATALVGLFPGSPLAVTALVAEPFPGPDADRDRVGWQWRTWHAYPSSREIVSTVTRVMRDDARGSAGFRGTRRRARPGPVR